MRVVTLNIRHGGPRDPDRAGRLIALLLGHRADLIVLTEFRGNATGERLAAALHASGYATAAPDSPPRTNAVLLASRPPLRAARGLDAALPEPWKLWRAETAALDVAGVHLPVLRGKIPYWDSVLAAARAPDAPCLFIGDFNTGRNDLDRDPAGMRFVGPESMDHMAEAGFTDLWRARHPRRREYSWFSTPRRDGFRLDHAFGNGRIAAAVRACRFDHRARLAGLTDHAALVLDLHGPAMQPAGP